MNDLERKIAAFLKEAHPSAAGGPEAIANSADLFADGWMDSLLHLKLLAFLEAEFGLRVPAFQVTRRSFQTVAAIAALVSRGR